MGLLAWLGTRWVARRRARHRPAAAPLPAAARAALADFFPAGTLDTARMAVVPGIAPPLALSLARWLKPVPLDFGRLVAITFDDTIVVAERLSDPFLVATLFHELVHVEQVRQLGLRAFVRRYLREWWEGGRRYAAIPLERDAYALQRRFAAAPDEPFDVATEVARRLAAPGHDENASMR